MKHKCSVLYKWVLTSLLAVGCVNAYAGGGLAVFYDGIEGTAVADLTSAGHFPTGPNPGGGVPQPLVAFLLTDELDYQPDEDVDIYGTHMRGYLYAPMDGDYRFFTASDDASELWISSDATVGNTNLVAFETGCCTDLFDGARLSERSSDPMTLTRGEIYYFEYFHKEGGGGDWFQIGWEKPDGTQEIIPTAYVEPFALNEDGNNLQPRTDFAPEYPADYFAGVYANTVPNSGHPADVSVTESRQAEFTATVLADPAASFQWQVSTDGGGSWSDIDGEVLPTYTIESTSLDQSGNQYRVIASNSEGDSTSNAATLTVNADTTAPTIETALTRGNPNGVDLTFSEAVAEASATDSANYSINNGVTVDSAEQLSDNVVRLNTSEITGGQVYTVTATGVEDLAATPNTSDSQADFVQVQGVIARKEFQNIGGGTVVTDLQNSSKFPDNPDLVDYRSLFETPVDAQDAYGVQFVGLFTPLQTGDYTFYISSDDQGVLWLSTDDNPANKEQIASEPTWNGSREWVTPSNADSRNPDDPENVSDPITLQAGQNYYIEAQMKEGGGGDNLAVLAQPPGAPTPANGDSPITGANLSTLEPNGSIEIVEAPSDQTVTELREASFSVSVEGTPPYDFTWRVNGEVVGDGIFSSGKSSTLAFDASLGDDQAEISVEVANGFSSASADPVTLTVEADTTPPGIDRVEAPTYADAPNNTFSLATVVFDEPVTQATAEDTANYSVDQGLTVNNATLQGDQQSVLLETSEQAEGTEYTVTVNGVTDLSDAANTANGAQGSWLSWVTRPGIARAMYNYTGNFVADDIYGGPGDLPDGALPFGPDPGQNSMLLDIFESPRDAADNYGLVLFGWVVPPADGDYTFYLSSDDNSQLYLSTDDDPANATQIASEPQWNGYRNWTGTDRRPNQENISNPQSLVADQRYYIELAVNEGTGGDGAELGWQQPGEDAPANGDNISLTEEHVVTLAPGSNEPLLLSQSPGAGDVAVANDGTIQVVLEDGNTGLAPVDPDSVVMTLNGEEVTPTVTRDEDALPYPTTTIEFTPSEPFDSFAEQNVQLTFGFGDQERTLEWSFKSALDPTTTFVDGTRYIEAEDFNADIDGDGVGGEWIEGANGGPNGERYDGGEYAGLAAVHEVDYFEQGDNEDGVAYRQQALVDAGQLRVQFQIFTNGLNAVRGDFTATNNYKIGWTTEGDWLNFTRDFPAEETTYDVYANVPSGGADPNSSLQRVTSDPTQPDQTVEQLGEFSGAASGDWGTGIFYRMHEPGDPETPAQVTLSGTQTLRWTRGPGAMDYNYLAFVPAGPIVEEPEISVSLDDSGNITLQWTGTLYSADEVTGPYTEVSGASSPMEISPDDAQKYYKSGN